MTIERNVFPTRDELAQALAISVADDLIAGIEENGVASLAVSGGSTPAAFFAALGAREEIDWESVTVTLVDERWVDETSERSNAKLVRERLMSGPAAQAQLVPLYSGGDAPTADAVARTNTALLALPDRFDAVVLGMGGDGHTASFFPGGDTLDAALSAKGPLVAIEAPGAGEPRVTLTLPRLLSTRALYLHIEGEEKARVLDAALATGPVHAMPVRAVLSQGTVTVQLFWCP
ncbi:6-phosphogluconolactonase [Pelagibacterium montanilacus]|uniref:6-phosphogluconolactonase n=1 Tax=Pelagibacterium montanilacus TaxID=2185280 RepID=UPI000F8EB1C9|nr:6-phosphogluconolactonase [Pelagibacterium montanilacus]